MRILARTSDDIERMDADSILEALVNGEAIEAPPVKKRGRREVEKTILIDLTPRV